MLKLSVLGIRELRGGGLWRIQIQDYLISVVQKIQILMDHLRGHATSTAMRLREQVITFLENHKCFLQSILNVLFIT